MIEFFPLRLRECTATLLATLLCLTMLGGQASAGDPPAEEQKPPAEAPAEYKRPPIRKLDSVKEVEDAPKHPVAEGPQAFKSLQSGDHIESYFEVLSNGQVFGYAILTVDTAPAGESPPANYRREAFLQIDKGTTEQDKTTKGIVTAQMTLDFEPTHLSLESIRDDYGDIMRSVSRLIFKEGKMDVQQIIGNRIFANEIDAPPSPFVFGVEAVMHRVDPRSTREFQLVELNPKEGKLNLLKCEVVPQSEGGFKIMARGPSETEYIFDYDAEGVLQSWGRPNTDIVERRTTKERVEELKAQWGQ